MSTALLRETFLELLGPEKAMRERNLPRFQETANGLDAAKFMTMARGA